MTPQTTPSSELEIPPTVVLGFAEAFAAIESAWSLLAGGMTMVAFTREDTKPALRHVRGIRIVPVPPPERDALATVAAVSRILREVRADVFLPLDDSSLWLSRQVDLGSCVVAGPDADGVNLALDKARQLTLAAESGFVVPPTRTFTDVSAVPLDSGALCIKPAHAVRLDGRRLIRPRGRLCGNAAEYELARSEVTPGPIVTQPVIRGAGEGVFGFVDEAGPQCLTGHRRIRMMNPQGSASSACISKDVEPALVDATCRFLTSACWRGLFMVEILRDTDGTPWFMELNGRAWGSLALARRRGYEYPLWAVQAALGRAMIPLPPSDPPLIRARHLGREMAHLAFVLRGPQSVCMIDEWPGRTRTLADLLSVDPRDRLYNFDARHPRVLAADTWQSLADLSRSRRARARMRACPDAMSSDGQNLPLRADLRIERE